MESKGSSRRLMKLYEGRGWALNVREVKGPVGHVGYVTQKKALYGSAKRHIGLG